MTESGRLLCPDCGTDNEVNARFCSYCGSTLTRPWSLENDAPRPVVARKETAAGTGRSVARAHSATGTLGFGAGNSAAAPIPSEEETIELLGLLARPSTLDPTLTQSEWTQPPVNRTAATGGVLTPAAGRPEGPPKGDASRSGSGEPQTERTAPRTLSGAVPVSSATLEIGSPAAESSGPQAAKAHPRRAGSLFRTVTLIAGAALLTGLLGYLGAVFLIKPGQDDRVAAQSAPRGTAAGRLSVEVPSGLPANSLRVTVVRDNAPAKAANGELLKGLPPEKIGGVSLKPGSYIVRFLYRRTPLREVRAEIRRGQDTIIQPSRWQLADIEYSAGEAAARLGSPDEDGDSDVVHFRRALKFDPDHVNAHLQMAAYELLNGKRSDVERHLGNIRRLAPQHPDLAQLEALLKKRKRGS